MAAFFVEKNYLFAGHSIAGVPSWSFMWADPDTISHPRDNQTLVPDFKMTLQPAFAHSEKL